MPRQAAYRRAQSVTMSVPAACMKEISLRPAQHAQPAPGTALGQQNPLGKAMHIFPHEHS